MYSMVAPVAVTPELYPYRSPKKISPTLQAMVCDVPYPTNVNEGVSVHSNKTRIVSL